MNFLGNEERRTSLLYLFTHRAIAAAASKCVVIRHDMAYTTTRRTWIYFYVSFLWFFRNLFDWWKVLAGYIYNSLGIQNRWVWRTWVLYVVSFFLIWSSSVGALIKPSIEIEVRNFRWIIPMYWHRFNKFSNCCSNTMVYIYASRALGIEYKLM